MKYVIKKKRKVHTSCDWYNSEKVQNQNRLGLPLKKVFISYFSESPVWYSGQTILVLCHLFNDLISSVLIALFPDLMFQYFLCYY